MPLTKTVASLVPCLGWPQRASAARIAALRRPLSRPATGFSNSGMLNSSASLLFSSILSHHRLIIPSLLSLPPSAREKSEAHRFFFLLSLSARHVVQVVRPRPPGCPGLWRSRPGKLSRTLRRPPLEIHAPMGATPPHEAIGVRYRDGLTDCDFLDRRPSLLKPPPPRSSTPRSRPRFPTPSSSACASSTASPRAPSSR